MRLLELNLLWLTEGEVNIKRKRKQIDMVAPPTKEAQDRPLLIATECSK